MRCPKCNSLVIKELQPKEGYITQAACLGCNYKAARSLFFGGINLPFELANPPKEEATPKTEPLYMNASEITFELNMVEVPQFSEKELEDYVKLLRDDRMRELLRLAMIGLKVEKITHRNIL